MAKSLQEYADWLEERELLWPVAPKPIPVSATPSLKPLPNVRGVTWSLYGTLLTISDGRLLLQHPQQIRMQVALEKTIQEFNMWNSMSRKPGAPWEYMLQQYTRLIEDAQLAGSGRKGEAAEINSAVIWRILIERLGKKEYSYDEETYGDLDEFAEKVAYFFHSCLQGVAAAPQALTALKGLAEGGIAQGIVADAQSFSLVQLLRGLKQQGSVPPLGTLFSSGCLSLSYREGFRQPSRTLFERCIADFDNLGISSREILHISSRLNDDLGPAKQFGLRTALYTGDKLGVQATAADLKNPDLRPDRILTELGQVRQILGVDS